MIEEITTQYPIKTHVFNESPEIQIDGLTLERDQDQLISIPIQQESNQMNAANRSSLKDMMIKFSVEDSLIHFKEEATISQFIASHNDGKVCGATTTKKILERIKDGELSLRAGNGLAVTWAGRFTKVLEPDTITKYSGFTAIEFVFQSDDLKEFWDVLKKDSFSCIVIADEIARKLTVIVKISAKSVQDYSLAYQHLIDYYSGCYGLKEYEFLDMTADVCRLYELKANLKVYHNPYSRRLNSFIADSLSKEIVDVSSSPIEPISTNLEVMPTEQIGLLGGEISETKKNDDHFPASLISTLDKTSLIDSEQVRTKLVDGFPDVSEWYRSNFLANSCGNRDLNVQGIKPKIDISIKPDDSNDDLFEYIISENQDGKKNRLVSFLIDSRTGSRVICGEKSMHSASKDKKRKGNAIKVMESLVKILSAGEKETGEVQKLLELEFKCSPRTIRGRIENIISGQIRAINNLNKTVTLLKNRRGQKHFLSLVEVNQG